MPQIGFRGGQTGFEDRPPGFPERDVLRPEAADEIVQLACDWRPVACRAARAAKCGIPAKIQHRPGDPHPRRPQVALRYRVTDGSFVLPSFPRNCANESSSRPMWRAMLAAAGVMKGNNAPVMNPTI
jgi:hypothetical protein